MATIAFISSLEPVLKNDGTVNASGTVEFYVAGTAFASPLAVYTDSSLSTSAGSIITLSSAGTFQCYVGSNADIKIKDSTGSLVRSVLNINPATTASASDANLLTNGSFETIVGSNSPSNWTLFEYVVGANTVDTTVETHGTNSMKFTSTGAGGGSVTSTLFTSNPLVPLITSFSLKSTIATVRNIVVLNWYDKSQALLSTTTLYDDTVTNPTSWTIKTYVTTPPANAVWCAIKATGCDPASAIAGSTWFDDFRVNELSIVNAAMTFNSTITFVTSPIVPTLSPGDNTNKAASTAFVTAVAPASLASASKLFNYQNFK